MLVYIAGPIRGKRNYNQLAFHRAEIYLEKLGHTVINPIRMDEDYDGEINAHEDQLVYARRDAGAILGDLGHRFEGVPVLRDPIDAIYMLSGWSNSVGSRAELALAQWIGAKVWLEDPGETTAILEVANEND